MEENPQMDIELHTVGMYTDRKLQRWLGAHLCFCMLCLYASIHELLTFRLGSLTDYSCTYFGCRQV